MKATFKITSKVLLKIKQEVITIIELIFFKLLLIGFSIKSLIN